LVAPDLRIMMNYNKMKSLAVWYVQGQ